MGTDSETREVTDDIIKLHDRIVTFDSHIDIPINFGSKDLPADVDGSAKFDLAKVKRGHLKGASLTVRANAFQPGEENIRKAKDEQERYFSAISGLAKDFPDRVGIASTPDQFRDIVGAKKFAVLLAFQNAFSLTSLGELEAWIARGIRMVGLAFIGNNRWTDSARPYPFFGQGLRNGGLSDLGKAGVKLLNDFGVVVDVSQLSSEAIRDVLQISKAPIVASHSALCGLVEKDRNLTDDQILAIKQGGGVVQVVGFGSYLKALPNDIQKDVQDVWKRFGLKPPQTLAEMGSINDPETASWDNDKFQDLLHEYHVVLKLDKPAASVRDLGAAIDYAVQKIGIDHVGVSSDFNHGGGLLGWLDVGQSMNVTAELVARGYSPSDIAKIWGENFLRVWRDVTTAKNRA